MSDDNPNPAPQPNLIPDEMPGKPRPMRRLPSVLKVVTIAVGGTGLFVLATGMLTPTLGAQRSTRLQWEQRQQEIEQAIAKAEQVEP